MSDPRVENLAKILVNYSTEVKPGDWVLVMGNSIAAPLINAVQRYVLFSSKKQRPKLRCNALNALSSLAICCVK